MFAAASFRGEHEQTRRIGIRSTLVLFASIAALLGFTTAGAAHAQTTDDPALFEQGEAIYNGGCAGCHGITGMGSGAGRDLTGIAEEQPDRSVHIASVTNGKGGMPAYGGSLEPEEIDAAVAYVRLAFIQDEEASEEPMTELPNTGFASWLVGSAAALIAAGGGMVGLSLAVERNKRLRPVRVRNDRRRSRL